MSFTVPVDEVQKISFSIGVEQGSREPGAAVSLRDIADESTIRDESLPAVLTIRSDGGLKLVRGFYIIVPLFENDSEPSWPAYHLDQVGGRWALYDRNGDVVPFEHFVLRIDYANRQRE